MDFNRGQRVRVPHPEHPDQCIEATYIEQVATGGHTQRQHEALEHSPQAWVEWENWRFVVPLKDVEPID